MDNSLITSVKSKRDFICKEESGLHGVRYTKFKPKLEKTSLLLLLLTDFKKISAAAVFKSLINLINLITALWKNFLFFRFYKLRFCGQDRKKIQPCTFKRFARRLLQRKPCVIFIHQYPRSGKLQKRQYFAPAHAFFGSPSTGTVIRKEVFL